MGLGVTTQAGVDAEGGGAGAGGFTAHAVQGYLRRLGDDALRAGYMYGTVLARGLEARRLRPQANTIDR